MLFTNLEQVDLVTAGLSRLIGQLVVPSHPIYDFHSIHLLRGPVNAPADNAA